MTIQVKLVRNVATISLFAGEIAGLDDELALRLIADGRAVRVGSPAEAPEQATEEVVAEAPPEPEAEEPPATSREAIHKGRGVWAVVDESGEEIATGLTKEQAGEMVAQS